MKMMLLVSTTAVVAVFHVLSSSSATDVHTTQSTPKTTELPANYSKVTCYFNKDTCGWTNLGGEDYPLTWKRNNDDAMMYLDMDGDAKGRLASPWLDPLENHRCQLKFDYQLDTLWSKTCQLTLLRQSASGQEDVITVLDHKTWSLSETTEPVNCTGERFRMVFEGWKSCGSVFSGQIKLDDIEFNVTYVQPTPQTRAKSSEGTGATTVASNGHVTASSVVVTSSLETPPDHNTGVRVTTKPSRNKADDNSSGLDSGSLAGIIIAVIIVIVVVVIIVVMLMLRRGKNKGKVVSPRQIVSPDRMNAAFTASTDDLRTAGILGVIGGNPSGGEAEEDNYEIVDLPPASTPSTHLSNNATHSDDNDKARPHQPHPPPPMKGASHESDVYMNMTMRFVK